MLPVFIVAKVRLGFSQNSHNIQTYTLTDAHNKYAEVFNKAAIEPVLLSKQSRPSHVILSANNYEKLIDRMQDLENILFDKNRNVNQ